MADQGHRVPTDAVTLIAVWGMGGVGKTTLVTNVFKEVAKSCPFDCAAWVSVSRTFTTADLLRRIVKELHKIVRIRTSRDLEEMNYHSLIEVLHGLLSERRYLVLLDDVWDANAWELIRDGFLENGRGCRIIITTRNQNVANLAKSTRILLLKPLPEKDAWRLFCNTAFRKDDDRECPSYLEQWASKILDKCHGLPLAIVSVGNLLATSRRNEDDWKNVHNSLGWDESPDPGIVRVSSILNLSIDYLPDPLKRCFVYCSIYPEDFFIKRKTLIRMWIAEGLVEKKRHATMEDAADDYLNRLVQRNLLQVMMTNEFGRAKRFQIHDLMRELIVSRSAKEGLLVLSKEASEFDTSCNVRHLILDRYKSGDFPTQKMTSLRSFHAFKTDLDASLLSRFRLLTVLNLWYIPVNKLPSAVTNLLNLHYLGIRSTLIKELPQELGRLHKLQTLDAKWSMVQRLPSSITKLKGLRHLILFTRHGSDFRIMFPGKAVVLPDGMANLTCLQTLKYIEADENLIRSLGSLRQMRSLELSGVHEGSLVHLPSSISKMSYLVSLGIISRDANVELDLEPFSPPPLKLQKLTLKGRLTGCKLPSWFACLSNLMELRLHSSELNEDSIGLLSSLPRLFDLSLWGAYKEKRLTFAARGYPFLTRLRLQDLPCLAHVEFQKGSLVNLKKLMLSYCANLIEVPQGIENLINLENLGLFGMPSELSRKIQESQESGGNHQANKHIIMVEDISVHQGQLLEKKFHANLTSLQN